jgi:hypothetical protein
MIPGQMYSIGVVGIGYDSPSMLEIGGIPGIRGNTPAYICRSWLWKRLLCVIAWMVACLHRK